MAKLTKLAKVSESITINRYDNGWMVEVGGRNKKEDWATAKTLCNTEEELIALIKEYNAFYPFCKTHSGVDHYRCQLMEARWEYVADQHQFIFHISANRFLRGMVRLIVGACMQVGIGQLTLEDVRKALNEQTHLPKSWSVPPDGLFLTDIQYGTRAAV